MAASASDYFQKVAMATATTLSAPGYTTGNTSINVASTTNWPTTTGVTFAIDEIDSAGERVSGTYNIFRGTVNSATQITNVTYVGGDANRNYSAGATTRVYILVSYAQMNRLIDGLLVSHNQDGTMITSLPLTTPKITTSINDASGNEVIKTPATASAVNEITVTNAATGANPTITATGGDTNVGLEFAPKGTGNIYFTHLYDWQKGSSTWTYASSTTFTVPQSDADLMAVGTKIWFTQTTSKYFYVVSKSGTTITVTGGSDYSVANAAITAPYFSNAETPVGFPDYFNYTPTFANTTLGNGTVTGRFTMHGKTVDGRALFTLGSTSAVSTGPTCTLPVTSTSTQYTTLLSHIGVCVINDAGVATNFGPARWVSTTTCDPVVWNAASIYLALNGITATVPFTFGNTDSIGLLFKYEAA